MHTKSHQSKTSTNSKTSANNGTAEPAKVAAIQPKLTVGEPNDKYEREADQVADRVVSGQKTLTPKSDSFSSNSLSSSGISISRLVESPEEKNKPSVQTRPLRDQKEEPDVQLQTQLEDEPPAKVQLKSKQEEDPNTQRQPESDEELSPKLQLKQEDDEHPDVQTKPTTPGSGQSASIESSLNSSKGGGNPLPDHTRSFMESRIGADFSGVKVHTDSQAIQMNKELNAQAFTHGNDVYFNQGKYNPDSSSGKHLLSHELTHTVQQGASQNTIQRKPQDYQHGSDGRNVKNRMYEKAKAESDEDVDFSKPKSSMTPEEREKSRTIDSSEKSKQRAGIKSAGSAKPDIDRPANELPKVEEAKEKGKKNLKKPPKKKDKEAAPRDKPRVDLSTSDQMEQQALIARQQAESIKMPEKPEELVAPIIKKPVDRQGKPVGSDANNDKNVRALHEIAKLFVENAYGLRQEAINDKKESLNMRGKIDESYAKVERTKAGSQLMKEDTSSREEVNNKESKALGKVEKDTAMVKSEAPKLQDKSAEGKKESSPMAEEAQKSKAEMEAKQPEDAEAAVDAKKQSAETDKVANESKSMDDAFGQSGARSEKYFNEALIGEEKNIQTRGKIAENKIIVEQTRAEIFRIDEENLLAQEQLDALKSYPDKVVAETDQRERTAVELYGKAVSMNKELVAIQEEYYSRLSALPGKEEAQKKLNEERAKEQKEPQAPLLTPEEELLISMGNMEEEELNELLMEMDENELQSLDKSLDGMETEEDNDKNALVGKPDKHTGRVKVDLMKAFQDEDESQAPADPRQQEIGAIEQKRTERLGGVKNTADANFTFISAEQKQMLSQKLAMQDAVSGLFNINLLDMGKAMIMGMINPVESLKGVIDGAGKMLSGAVNLFNAKAWEKDPLGNLLQSAADIATGLTMVFMSITGLATAITIIMTAITIATLGFAAPVTGPIIAFMAGVITTVGGWTIVTGLIALALNALTYIKNVHDAGVAENTDQLLAESDSIKQNMTDGFTSAMAVVGAKGDVAGAKAMQKSILKAGGGKAFAKTKGQGFKQGLQKAGQGAKNFVKGGVVKGTKRLAVSAASKVKNGIKNALNKAKKGIKEAPINIKNKFKSGLDKVKDKFRRKKSGGEIDTPHGKLRTPTKGDNLGSFDGQKVKAEMDFPDGHKAKSLESGQCAVCSNCKTIKKKFGPELDDNPKLSKELKDLEAKIKADGDTPDAADIARQKEIHDQFLDQKAQRVKKEYDSEAPSGRLSEREIKERLANDKEFDPKTKRFGDDGSKKAGLSDAEKQALQKGGGTEIFTSGKAKAELKARKAKVEKEIEGIKAKNKDLSDRAKDKSNTDPDAVEYRNEKNKSFEKRHPEAESKKKFEEEYDKAFGKNKDANPNYESDKSKYVENARAKQREMHSKDYDSGRINYDKGKAFENVRALDGAVENYSGKKIPVEIPPDNRKVNISPDIKTSNGYIEMKSGKLKMSADVEDQMARYAALKEKVVYELLEGADDGVIAKLKAYGIDYIDYSKL